MAERSIIDQLDDAVTAMNEQRVVDFTTLDTQVATLAGVARDLLGLPTESFRNTLKENLMRGDSMSSPAQKLESPTVRTVTLSLCVSDANAAIDFYREAFGAEELFRLAEPSG